MVMKMVPGLQNYIIIKARKYPTKRSILTYISVKKYKMVLNHSVYVRCPPQELEFGSTSFEALELRDRKEGFPKRRKYKTAKNKYLPQKPTF